MSNSFHALTCGVCGGDTSTSGQAARSHERSQRHIDALMTLGHVDRAKALQRERDRLREQRRQRWRRGE